VEILNKRKKKSEPQTTKPRPKPRIIHKKRTQRDEKSGEEKSGEEIAQGQHKRRKLTNDK